MSDITWTNITVKLGDLKPWTDNPRHSTKAQAKRILASFDRFGQVAPIAVSPALEVYDGHQRLSALLTVHGAGYEVEARQSSRPLTDDERRGLVLALANATGSWDWDKLSSWSTEQLDGWGFNKETWQGWRNDLDNLKEFINSQEVPTDAGTDTEVGDTDALLEKWQVKYGQLWVADQQRVLCGDSAKRDDVERLLNGEKVDCLIADAPYGMNLNTHYKRGDTGEYNGVTDANRNNYAPVIGDDADFDPRPVMELFDCAEQFWFGADYYAERIPNKNNGSWLIWDKRAGIEDIEFSLSEFETIWSKKRRLRQILRVKWFGIQGMEKQDTKERVHPTQKPLELIEKLVNLCGSYSFADPYLGSGTTLAVCHKLGKRGFGMELSPEYVAITLERLSRLGVEPVLCDQ